MRAIRNVAIISHINHGKSTLADRFLEIGGAVSPRNARPQMLDDMELERERGMTIKLTPVRLKVGDTQIHLIDTPGHVDFAYEVSRALAAVEGAILLVDSTQGIQAQTLAVLDLARQAHLTILPVVNKIDLPTADVPGTAAELAQLALVPIASVQCVSAKTGEGVPALLDAIIARVPPPRGNPAGPLRALVFDSSFDAHRGVIISVRVVDGSVRSGDDLTFLATATEARALAVGIFRLANVPTGELSTGEIGYVATGVREPALVRVGDTLARGGEVVEPLAGYTEPPPVVFASVHPESGEEFPALRAALERLRLSDAALTVETESFGPLGSGFRCGFLGLLHLDIVRERLRREYDREVLLTAPSVAYRVRTRGGRELVARSAKDFPEPTDILDVREPWVFVRVLARRSDLPAVLRLLSARSAAAPQVESLPADRLAVTAEVPLRKVLVDFHDALMGATAGHGSFAVLPSGDRPIDLVKLSVRVNYAPVAALSVLVPRADAVTAGQRLVQRLKQAIPRHLFPVPLQATIGGTIVARETIPALRKDVTAPLYGGDVTRKRKLLARQKRGKKKLAAHGTVRLPPAAFAALLP